MQTHKDQQDVRPEEKQGSDRQKLYIKMDMAFDVVWRPMSLIHVPSTNMEQAGLMTFLGRRHVVQLFGRNRKMSLLIKTRVSEIMSFFF